MIDISTTLALISGIIALCYFYIRHLQSYWVLVGVPFEKPSIIFGNYKSLILQREFNGDLFKRLYQSRNEKFFGIYEIFSPALVIRDPILANTCLIRESDRFLNRGFYTDEENDPMSINIITLRDEKWRNARKKVSNSLTLAKIKPMFQNFPSIIKPFIKYLDSKSDSGEPFEVCNLAACYTADFAASLVFGLEEHSIEDPKAPFKVTCEKHFVQSPANAMRQFMFMFTPKLMKLFGVNFIPPYLQNYFKKVVAEVVSHRKQNKVKRSDLMQILIETDWNDDPTNGPKLRSLYETDPILPIISHSYGLLIATYETSKTTIFFCIYELARNPEAQRKVQEELDELLKESNQITYDILNEAKYLNAVFAETLRIHPPLQQISRLCSEDFTIPNTSVTVKKGMRVIVPLIGLHLDENYYSEPEIFKPERFLGAQKSFEEMPYFPFGIGPRHCIGQKLGEIETKVFLAALIRKFEFYSENIQNVNVELSTKATLLNVTKDIQLNVRHRKKNSNKMQQVH